MHDGYERENESTLASERFSARAVLIFTILALTAALVAFPRPTSAQIPFLDDEGSEAQDQGEGDDGAPQPQMTEHEESPTPTPEETESPTPAPTNSPEPSPTGPAVAFLNPSGYQDPSYISNKQDVDELYHLNAWTNGAPSGAAVEFRCTGCSGSTETVIGLATRRGGASGDTWDLFWDTSGVPETGSADDPLGGSPHELRVILYDQAGPGASVLGEDTIEVFKNESGSVLFPEHEETVEITYPTNAGPLGIFQSPGGPRQFVIEATTSEDASHVKGFYAVSFPGAEPNWKECDGYQSVSDRSAEITCTLDEGDPIVDVRAVAVVANDAAPIVGASSATDQTGDAHRVLPYNQTVGSITLEPTSQTSWRDGDNNPQCALVTATVRDPSNRPIIGANVDAHAQGPSNGTRFGSIANQTSPFQAPDQGGHESQSAANCATRANAGTQGNHPTPGDSDVKHIETTAAGTDTSGQFRFAVIGDGTVGTTNIQAWVDLADNDVLSPGDPSANATVTQSDQPDPSPPPTATPTESPTESPTETPTESPGPSPTGTETQEPTVGRVVTLAPSRNVIRFPNTLKFSGTVEADDPVMCPHAGVPITVQRDVTGGNEQFETVHQDVTDSNGQFTFDWDADYNAQWIASIPQQGECAAANSNPRTVLVRAAAMLRLKPTRPRRGNRVRFIGRVRPCDANMPGTRLQLQKSIRGQWARVARKRLNNNCRARWNRRQNRNNAWRTVWGKQRPDLQRGASAQKLVQVRR